MKQKISKADREKIAQGLKRYTLWVPLHTGFSAEVWARNEDEAVEASRDMEGAPGEIMDNIQKDGATDIVEVWP